MSKTIPMTARGAEQLRKTLDELKHKQHQITDAISHARKYYGDLRENSEYDAAKGAQAEIECRIRKIEEKLAFGTVIDPSQLPNTGKVVFGTTVHLLNVDTQESHSYQIVGEDEADVKAGLLSINSPIARALISKEIDDTVRVQTPTGEQLFEITHIE